jgi:hypothetical protein
MGASVAIALSVAGYANRWRYERVDGQMIRVHRLTDRTEVLQDSGFVDLRRVGAVPASAAAPDPCAYMALPESTKRAYLARFSDPMVPIGACSSTVSHQTSGAR